MRFIKRLIFIFIIMICTVVLLINSYVGYKLNGYKGILGIYLSFQMPNYIKEGELEYKSDNITLSFVFKDINENKDGRYYIGDCYFENSSKNLNYEYYKFELNYWTSRSGKIFVIGHNEEEDNKPSFDVGGNSVFWGDFKFKWNGDLICYNLNDDNEFWDGSKEILLKKAN